VRLQLETIYLDRKICFIICASGELQYELQLKYNDINLLSSKVIRSP
jgi:hypothetical protein